MTDTTEPNIPENELGHRRRVLALGSDIADLLNDLVDRAKEYRELGVPAREWLDVVSEHLPDKASRVLDFANSWLAPAIDIGLSMATGTPLSDAATEVISDAARRDAAGLAATPPEPEQSQERLNLTSGRRLAVSLSTGAREMVVADDLENLAKCYLALDADAIRYAEDSNTIRMRSVIARLFAEAPKLEGKEDQAPALEVHILLRSGAPIQFSGILSTTPEGGLRLMTPTQDGKGKPCMIEQFFDYSDVTSVAVVREVQTTGGSRIVTS